MFQFGCARGSFVCLVGVVLGGFRILGWPRCGDLEGLFVSEFSLWDLFKGWDFVFDFEYVVVWGWVVFDCVTVVSVLLYFAGCVFDGGCLSGALWLRYLAWMSTCFGFVFYYCVCGFLVLMRCSLFDL